jgi:hypothetical protein
MAIVMRLSVKFILLLTPLFFVVTGCYSQNSYNSMALYDKSHEVYGGYGVFSFYKIGNAAVYTSTKSTGLVFAGYTHHLNSDYSIGILFGTEKIKPEVKNSTDTYYVRRMFVLSRINKVLVHRDNFDLYVSVLGGINREEKQLIDENKTSYEPIYDFVFIGLKYRFTKNYLVFAETGYNQLSLFRCGLSVYF